MKLRKSRTSPTLISFIIATMRSRMSLQRDFGTYMRLAAEHFCPWNSNAPRTAATATSCGSADGCTTMKSLPGFADEARITAVLPEVLSNLLPHAVEHAGAAGEVNAAEVGMIE